MIRSGAVRKRVMVARAERRCWGGRRASGRRHGGDDDHQEDGMRAHDGQGAEADRRPCNLVMVFPDQFRAQSLGLWSTSDFAGCLRGGGDPVHTPHLDAFARESLVLPRATSTAPVCSPYRGMLFSGCLPHRNGVPHNCGHDRPDCQLCTDRTCLTDVLAAAGYDSFVRGSGSTASPTSSASMTMPIPISSARSRPRMRPSCSHSCVPAYRPEAGAQRAGVLVVPCSSRTSMMRRAAPGRPSAAARSRMRASRGGSPSRVWTL